MGTSAEFRVLLEAVVRELSDVAEKLSALPGSELGASEAAHAEVVAAQLAAAAAVESASSEADEALPGAWARSNCSDSRCSDETVGESLPVILEARKLHAEAARARDIAEAQRWALRDEHGTLLAKFHELTAARAEASEERDTAYRLSEERERSLLSECDSQQAEVRKARLDVEALSRRLLRVDARGHALRLSQRRLQRQHDGWLAETKVAREILRLQTETATHLKDVSARCEQMDVSIAEEHAVCMERTAELHAEWAVQQDAYEKEMNVLEARLMEIESTFRDRWTTREEDAQTRLESRIRRGIEAQVELSHQVAALDSQRASEMASAHEEVEKRHRTANKTLSQAEELLAGRLEERKRSLREAADTERRRCASLREKQREKASALEGEVRHYRAQIGKMLANYRGLR